MFDQQAYAKIFEVVLTILNNNVNQLGRQFCDGFLVDYDPRRGYTSQRNAESLFSFVAQQAQRLNNNNSLTDNQLFEVIGFYIKDIFQRWQQQQMGARPGYGGGYSIPVQNVGSAMGYGQVNFGVGQSPAIVSTPRLDDTVDKPGPSPTMTTMSPQPTSTMSSKTPYVEEKIMYSNNPLDTLDNNSDFTTVKTSASWGEVKPDNRLIVITQREDLKTKDHNLTINRSGAYYQVIHNNPIEVLKDFFKIVPDTYLSQNFFMKINYLHLDVIDVPTNNFVEIRKQCIDTLMHEPTALIHKKISDVLDTMSRGPWKAMTQYLVHHINKALVLNCRLSQQPNYYIKIHEFEDLNEILSSNFRHPFTDFQEGRYLLERIVTNAIWNALVMNSDAMFTDDVIPTHAINASPAFPFSIPGVYPNKFAIPTSQEENSEKFLKALREKELSHKSYVLSRRAICVTNVLRKNELSKIVNDDIVSITSPIAPILNAVQIPYTKLNISTSQEMIRTIAPYTSEEYPSHQLDAYYEDVKGYEIKEVETLERIRPVIYPVDQTVFAIQYGVSPDKYLMPLNVHSTLDEKLGYSGMLLSKRKFPELFSR